MPLSPPMPVSRGFMPYDPLGDFTINEFDLVEPRDPSVFEKNEHGHDVFTIAGLNLTGEQEIERLEAADYRFLPGAEPCFRDKEYDPFHRLAEQEYKIVLMRHTVGGPGFDRHTESLRGKAHEFGYQDPVAGIIPRIREAVSDQQMNKIRAYNIVAFHKPIRDCVLSSSSGGVGRWIDATWFRAWWHAHTGYSAWLLPP